ncbi:MAG: hypothetical protein NTV44_04930 [Firmicutes bacterium]|nr:hypothetical protein [Bacillota bacterium]
MNKKKKLLVGAASMLLLTATAATASTFAWFTTVRNATINYSSATVYTNSGSIKVSWVSSLVSTWGTPSATDNNLSISGAHRITDISGEASAFSNLYGTLTILMALSLTASLLSQPPLKATRMAITLTLRLRLKERTPMALA